MIWVINGEHFKKNFTYFDKDFISWELKTDIIENIKLLKSEANARIFVVYNDSIAHEGITEILLRLKFVYDKRQNFFKYDLMHLNKPDAIKDRLSAEVYKLYLKNKIDTNRKPLIYNWNKPRMSWQGAQKPIFVDFNDDYLIWIKTNIGYNQGEAIKVLKKDFLAKYNPSE